MDRTCKLSHVTQAYLDVFYNILNTMIRDMTSVQLTNSISNNFINQMIPHHEAAIKMSRNILQYTTNLELQCIATNIISEQTKSISNMKAIQSKCSLLLNSDREISQYMHRFKEIAETMFKRMGSAPITNGVNVNFVREMIPHHEGAVQMSHNVLCFNICPPLKPILYAIISSQCEGIREMQLLLRRLDHC